MDSCLQQTLDEIRCATAGMSPTQLAWHPDGKWNSAQILEHLSLAFAGTSKGMRRVLASKTTAPARTLKNRLAALLVVRIGYFPSGRKSPAMIVPGDGNPATAVDTIVKNLSQMDTVLTDVEARKGRAARVPHPILGPLTIPEWRKFHLRHTRHHMKQIVRLRELQNS